MEINREVINEASKASREEWGRVIKLDDIQQGVFNLGFQSGVTWAMSIANAMQKGAKVV